jgi:hypothetical protein
MAKYIGTYTSSGDVQTALDNSELNRPFIAYTTDNDKVYYGPAADRAEAGDIVVYSTADDLLHYIKQADYSASTYPVADYVPVGVVAYPEPDDVIQGPTGEITFMGLKWLDKNNPDVGNSAPQRIEWGEYNFEIPELTNYANSGTAITDMNGKANTEIVLQYATAQTDWKTASAITYTRNDKYYPAFECAWRYHTSGTVQGDWYVPACGQFNHLLNSEELTKINDGFTAVGVTANLVGYVGNTIGPSTSTEFNPQYMWCFQNNSWQNGSKDAGNGYRARPFCSKLMTRI